MRTNDLFRDYLDNRIPGHETPRLAFVELTIEWDDPQSITYMDTLLPWQRKFWRALLDPLTIVATTTQGDFTLSPTPPADPRARALWAKQSRGTGPIPEPLRTRGRNNHYKEKP